MEKYFELKIDLKYQKTSVYETLYAMTIAVQKGDGIAILNIRKNINNEI